MISSGVRRLERQARTPTEPYGGLRSGDRYVHVTRDRAVLSLLQRKGFGALSRHRILELGCGEGSLLRTLLYYGAQPSALEGIDVDGSRVDRARDALPGVRVAVADIANLPYRDETFDIAFAFTVLSSVLDAEVRRRGAQEALRVLRPGGLLVVYDFTVNPFNHNVRPVGLPELRQLFAPLNVEVERVTLAPPIVRALGGRAALCAPLERVKPLRTHLLAAVEKTP